MHWNNDEIQLAINLCKNGKKYDEIADVVGRTKKAVRVKLNRLGFKLNDDVDYETVVCNNCGQEFRSLKNNKRKFCSSSCSAIVNNKLYPKKDSPIKKKCVSCGKELKNRSKKYCNNKCLSEYNKKNIFYLIENNKINLENKTTEGRWVKKYLIYKYGEKCMKCNWNEKHPITGKVPIELEHIDGKSENNNLENVILLCPNCHSLTPTYRALNVGNGRYSRRERYKDKKSY